MNRFTWIPAGPAAAPAPQAPVVRRPALAGTFYEADAQRLAAMVGACLEPEAARQDAAKQRSAEPGGSASPAPKLLIAPHAGHIYSGRTAGRAYARLRAQAGRVQRVVLLGPTHRVYVRGIALSGADAWMTPLGRVPIDRLGEQALADLPFVVSRPDVHAAEHSLEVHLPFLQAVLGDFTLLPLAVGDVPPQAVAQVMERLWGHEETLLVVSTDLSHFHPYDEAEAIDRASCAQVMALDARLTHEQACGATALNAALLLARQRGLRIEQIERCNSGDTAGDRARVVGYASFALHESAGDQTARTDATKNIALHPANTRVNGRFHSEYGQMPACGSALVRLARHALHAATGAPPVPAPAPNELPPPDLMGAAFVTLTQGGALRGCIGSLMAHRPLVDDVVANAQAAALRDTRFAPVGVAEAGGLHIEVSVLTPPQPLAFANEAHALWQLRPGVDGVIFEAVHDGRAWRSTFLPQVWAQIPDRRAFMAQLKRKAGLPPDFWSPGVSLSVYQVQEFHE